MWIFTNIIKNNTRYDFQQEGKMPHEKIIYIEKEMIIYICKSIRMESPCNNDLEVL